MPKTFFTFDTQYTKARVFNTREDYLAEIHRILRCYAYDIFSYSIITIIRENLNANGVVTKLDDVYEKFLKERTDGNFTRDQVLNDLVTSGAQEVPKVKKEVGKLKIVMAYDAFTEAFRARFKSALYVAKGSSDIASADLVIFSGGQDINPTIYNCKNKYSSGIDAFRDSVEMDRYRVAAMRGTKILGVCRGHQLIGALNGSQLYQDLYIELGKSHGGAHSLEVQNKNSLAALFKESGVNSLHHQALKNNWSSETQPTGYYNGVIEMIETNKIITTQFHPEFMGNIASDLFFEKVEEWAANG